MILKNYIRRNELKINWRDTMDGLFCLTIIWSYILVSMLNIYVQVDGASLICLEPFLLELHARILILVKYLFDSH